MSEQTDNEIKERLNKIFPSPEVAARVVNLVVHNRPVGWSKRSNAPYYKEVYAKQVKEAVDNMIKTGNPVVYRYSTWCTSESQMTSNTLYTRINQSIRYLVEQLDKDGTYAKWNQSVRVSRKAGVGVIMEYIPGLSSVNKFMPDEIQPREAMPLWKTKLEDWLESDNKTPFCIENLALSPDEISELKLQFATLTNVAASISSSYIKVIKLS